MVVGHTRAHLLLPSDSPLFYKEKSVQVAVWRSICSVGLGARIGLAEPDKIYMSYINIVGSFNINVSSNIV